jgi:shikimate dehydrogenase
MTTKFCVVGSPIVHSLSPVLHNAGYQLFGLKASYEKHEVAAGTLADFVSGSDFQGLSVTMPLKAEAFEFASWHDEYSSLTGIANTLLRNGEIWQAFNTDVLGLMKTLEDIKNPSSITLIGSGATTTSALVAISKLYPDSRVQVLARNVAELENQVELGAELGLTVATGLPEAQAVLSSDLVLSLVPQGSYPELWTEIAATNQGKSGWLFDVSYNPWPSPAALSWGLERSISGIEMLIWQGIEQFEVFVSGLLGSVEIDKSELYSVMKQAVS